MVSGVGKRRVASWGAVERPKNVDFQEITKRAATIAMQSLGTLSKQDSLRSDKASEHTFVEREYAADVPDAELEDLAHALCKAVIKKGWVLFSKQRRAPSTLVATELSSVKCAVRALIEPCGQKFKLRLDAAGRAQ